MKKIELTRGYVTMVDDDVYAVLAQLRWRASKQINTEYAVRWDNKKLVYMHRMIIGYPDLGVDLEVDHVDGDGLNNQRDNLRIATKSQNRRNMRKTRGTSQFKGVSLERKRSIWRAMIKQNGKNIQIGRFANEEEAAHAYDAKARELFGEFAKCNFKAAS